MIQRSSTALVLIAVLLAACSGSPPERESPSTGRTAWFDWAILPTERGADFGYEREAYWHPDVGTVRTALEGVYAYLRTQWETELGPGEGDTDIWHDMVWGVLEKLPAYKVQVIGIVEGGRKLVYFNFVHYMSLEPHPDDDPGEPSDWSQNPYVVDDGGDHYWQASYDPTTGAFVRMDINGEG